MQQRLFSTPVRSSPRPHSPSPPATSDHITVAEVGSEFLYASPENAKYTLSAVGVEVLNYSHSAEKMKKVVFMTNHWADLRSIIDNYPIYMGYETTYPMYMGYLSVGV